MITSIHKTLTDVDGNSYKVVSSKWLRVLTAIAAANFIILVLIVAVLIDNIRTINNEVIHTNKLGQRNRALSEIAASRAISAQWTYHKVCEDVKRRGEDCLENPKWYADPDKYPLIADDPMGAGLFPPK
jgi:hypothetical protein